MLKSRGTLKKRINLTPTRCSGTVTLSVTTGGDGSEMERRQPHAKINVELDTIRKMINNIIVTF